MTEPALRRYDVDANIIAAMRIPRQLRMTVWNDALEEHRRHQSFRVQTWPYTREYGFTCECSGAEQEWRIDITHMQALVPGVRAQIQRIFGFGPKAGDKLKKRQRARALVRSKALLHRHLTKAQRLELRYTKAFTMQGKDGRTYHVTEGSSTNIFIEHEGAKYVLCVIPQQPLPIFDTMLAQKVMLETDPEAFLRLARVRNMVTNDMYHSGGFILGDDIQPYRHSKDRDVARTLTVLIDVTDEQIIDPREWVETRLGLRFQPEVETVTEEASEQTQERVETRNA